MKSLLGKKAQLGSIQAIIITLIVLGIVLGLAFLIFQEFEETLGDTTGTVANETVVLVGLHAGGVYVDYNSTTSPGVWCYHDFNIFEVGNVTTATTVNAGNYSYEPATGKMWNVTPDMHITLGVNVSYTYKYSDSEACKALDTTVEATETIPTWLTIIVLLLIVGAILFVVFRILPQGTGETSTESGGGGSGSIGGFGGFSGGEGDTIAEI